MKPYQPSMAAPVMGLLILALVVLLGGAVSGMLVSLLSSQIYLIILFPVGMGWLGGRLVAAAVRAGKIRNPGVAMGAGILMAVVMYAALWGTEYLQFRSAQAAAIRSTNPQAMQAEIDHQIDADLIKSTGQGGFMGYVFAKDQKGLVVGRLPMPGLVFLLQGQALSWIYWLAEALLMAWIAGSIGRKPATQPFCESCNHWHGAERLLGTLGAKRSKEAINLIEGDQFLKLGEELQTNPSLPNVGVFLAQCGPDCTDGDAFLAVRSQVRSSSGKASAKDLATGMITPAQTQDVLQGIENRKALYGL